MIYIKKKLILLSILGLAMAGLVTFATIHVYAQTSTTTQYPSIVQKIASKFGLNEADVQAVFDQDRQDRLNQMEAKYEAQLTQDVTDGKITQEQKDAILAKHKELQGNNQALRDWAKQNNIDPRYLGGFGMRSHFMGIGK